MIITNYNLIGVYNFIYFIGFAKCDKSGEPSIEKVDLDLGASRDGSRTGKVIFMVWFLHNSLSVPLLSYLYVYGNLIFYP